MVKKPRGRPKKVVEEIIASDETPKKRGRPKKIIAEAMETAIEVAPV